MDIPKFFDNRYIHFYDQPEEKPSTESPDNSSAVAMNLQGYSVCFFPNEVVGGRHNKDCQRVRAWFVDIDYKGTAKPPVEDLLQHSPLIPTYIVESSAHGYHIYFLAKVAGIDTFKDIQERLVDWFGGDPKCKNLARLMRRPGFFHMKDPTKPFLTSVIYKSDAKYTEAQMRMAFPAPIDEDEDDPTVDTGVGAEPSTQPYDETKDSLFDYIRHYNSRTILQALSGTQWVGFKQYRFVRKGAHYNIIVDGKDTGSFINEKGNIIATDERYSGGAVEWLLYYPAVRNSRVTAMHAIKGVMGWD
jgi:hypothetical protein